MGNKKLTKVQAELLKKLSSVLNQISEEAQNDDNFNFKLAGLGILAKSADEAAAEIDELVD